MTYFKGEALGKITKDLFTVMALKCGLNCCLGLQGKAVCQHKSSDLGMLMVIPDSRGS